MKHVLGCSLTIVVLQVLHSPPLGQHSSSNDSYIFLENIKIYESQDRKHIKIPQNTQYT